MIVSQILKLKGSESVETISGDETLSSAVKRLSSRRIGALIIGDGGKGVGGVISERDIIRVLGEKGPGCLDQPVSSIMTRDVQTCDLDEQAVTVLERMTNGRFRHMPVVHDGVLRGVISIGDVVKARMSEIEHENEALADMIKGY